MNLIVIGLCAAWLAGGLSFTLGLMGAAKRESKWEAER